MSLLSPLALGLLALAIPIILLYMLKLRRKQVQVSSTLLWTQLIRDQQANAPWQKLKRNLLLILQLLILATLVLALARPALETRAVASGSVVILLDASASMNATDVSPSRFESARKMVSSIVDGLSGDSTLTLILVNHTPRALASAETDKAAIKGALLGAEASQGGANWESAFALAAGAAQGSRDVTTVIISDGGLPENGLPPLPGEVTYVPVGTSGDNLGITALALRPASRGPELFAEVTNFSSITQKALLSFYFGNELFAARDVEIPAGGRRSLTLDNLPTVAGVYRAVISSTQSGASLDDLPLDDTAFAVYQPSSLRRVLLVSNGNLFLEQLLASLPGIQPFRALPAADGALQIPEDPFDLYILDGVMPAEVPFGNVLLVNPASNPFFTVGAPFSEMTNPIVQPHDLTRYVDWSNVHILQAKSTLLPSWADALVSVDAGPLVFAGEIMGRRIASVNFDLRESDLPLQVAYPILFSNLINYLVPPSAFDAVQPLRPGESLEIALPLDADQVVVASPSNMAYSLPVNAATLTFTETHELGYYAVNFMSGNTSTAEYFAVNLFDDAESNIRPRENIQIGRRSITPADAEKIGQRELWPWLAGLALLVLMIEWQVYHRKQWSLPLTNRP